MVSLPTSQHTTPRRSNTSTENSQQTTNKGKAMKEVLVQSPAGESQISNVQRISNQEEQKTEDDRKRHRISTRHAINVSDSKR